MVPTPPKRTTRCLICLEVYDTEKEPGVFSYKCERCSSADFCATCLKSWFLDACKNESKMPPRCCRIIPLSCISKSMKPAEIELYKAKYEEWNTPNRLYCPVPTCSTFIPPRIFTEEVTVEHLPSMQTEKPASQLIKPNVACPACQTNICTGCRSFSHTGNCSDSDIDPELEGLLKRWKIQRCPKCRAGVRRVFGCAHVECRCGAHFCCVCLNLITICDGGCEDGDENDAADDDEYDDDDLDGNAGFHEDDGHEFGPGPYGTNLDQWACRHHLFNLGRQQLIQAAPNSVAECHNCFRALNFYDAVELPSKEEGTPMNGFPTRPAWPTNIYGEPAWQCVSGHIQCERCPRFAPLQRQNDGTRDIKCGCGIVCGECSTMMAEKDKGLAWECSCGMLVCGGCKDIVSARSAMTNDRSPS